MAHHRPALLVQPPQRHDDLPQCGGVGTGERQPTVRAPDVPAGAEVGAEVGAAVGAGRGVGAGHAQSVPGRSSRVHEYDDSLREVSGAQAHLPYLPVRRDPGGPAECGGHRRRCQPSFRASRPGALMLPVAGMPSADP
ncbi:hypothetical protein GCM10025734_82710 [Kitasatospora paranensis]